MLNVVFECRTWERCDVRSSMRTSFPLLSHHLLYFVHFCPLTILAWRALSWCRRTSARPSHDIEKSVAHIGPITLNCAMPLAGNFAIQAPIILVKLAFSLRRNFFPRGIYASAISYPENMENSAQVIRRTLAIIQ